MRKVLAVMVAALVAVAFATSAFAGARPVKNAKVNVDGFAFTPRTMTIKRYTKVVWKWVNGSDIKHDVAVAKGPVKFRSKLMAKGTFSYLFTKKGTYQLHCTIHPFMRETIVVK